MELPKRMATLEMAPALDREEPTLQAYESRVLRTLDRPPNHASRVEAQEHIRTEMMNALARASRQNPLVFAETVSVSVTPLPLLGPVSITTMSGTSVITAHAWREQTRVRRRPRRWRSNAPLATIVMALALFLGLLVQHRRAVTRAAATAQATKLARAHAAKLVPHRRR